MVYVIDFPWASVTEMLADSSGRSTFGILITGCRCVPGFSTRMGITPYILIGKSFTVCACGCISVMCTYTFGVISGVTENRNCVSPSLPSDQKLLIVLVPDSTLMSARLFFPEGNE